MSESAVSGFNGSGDGSDEDNDVEVDGDDRESEPFEPEDEDRSEGMKLSFGFENKSSTISEGEGLITDDGVFDGPDVDVLGERSSAGDDAVSEKI